MAIDLKKAYEEFSHLKTQNERRNYEYYLLRRAVKGEFRWPVDWPRHIPKITRNLCKRITRQHTTYLMGKGFTYNISRPNTLEYREAAERSEKILRRLFDLSRADIQFMMGAMTGSQLGRTVFKVYKKGQEGAKHACFSYCQPDYFYGIPSGDNHISDFSVVYYSYPLDIEEAKRIFGNADYKTEDILDQARRYNQRRDDESSIGYDRLRSRRVPVFEVWTKNEYALIVGGVTKHNGENPYKWKETGEGFVPFVVIENTRNAGEAAGEADIAEARELNEIYNQLYSMRMHNVKRWLRPTLVWEGAPPNYAQSLVQALEGGGAIPTRLGSRLSFLVHDRPNPAVLELEAATRAAILESSGMTETALAGTVTGSINTGPSAAMQFQPVLASVGSKQTEWTWGLKTLSAMMLELQEQIGNSKALGEAVINQTEKSKNFADGELVALSGKDISGLRDVEITWPDILPQDDYQNARLELEKLQAGVQSFYTTLEKLGEQYPDDEIARIRMENADPNLRGEKVAEQMRAQTPLIKAQMDQDMKQQQMTEEALSQMAAFDLSSMGALDEEIPPTPEDQNGIGARIRQAVAGSRARLDTESDEAVISTGY